MFNQVVPTDADGGQNLEQQRQPYPLKYAGDQGQFDQTAQQQPQVVQQQQPQVMQQQVQPVQQPQVIQPVQPVAVAAPVVAQQETPVVTHTPVQPYIDPANNLFVTRPKPT